MKDMDCSYFGSLIELGMFWLVLLGNVPQLQQLVPELHPVRQQSPHTALVTLQWLWLVQTSPCAQQPTQAEGAGGCATLCPCRQCPLAQCCLSLLLLASVCLTRSQSQLHPLKLTASFDFVFFFSYQ